MKKFALASAIFLGVHLTAASQPLKYEHVPAAIAEMLTYHVEYSQLNPTLIRRSFNVFLSRFDPKNNYLLRSEIEPFLTYNDAKLNTVLTDFNKGKFPEYVRLNKTIIASIQRARKIRASIRTQLLNKADLDLSKMTFATQTFPETQNDLYQITKNSMTNWLVYYASERGVTALDQPDRLKVLNYFEKKRRAHEDQYLITFEKPEPAFALNILKSVASSLDAHSMYYSASEANEIRTILLKQFCGVGLHLREGVEGSYVASVIENSPAARSGMIQKGDVLKQIDAQSVEDLYFKDVLRKMEGPADSKVTFLFERPESQDKFTVTLSREKISLEGDRLQVEAIPFADGIIATLTMNSFYENDEGVSLEADIREALKDLRARGQIYGLIIDLRNNAGGFLNQAIKTAGLFIKSGVVVIAKYAKDQIRYQRDLDPRQYYEGPMVVLTSKASASAAEILAASLQDEGVAVVVGDEKSYGKGTMQFQTVTDPNSRDFYKVTVGRYYTVSGKSTQIEGVKADVVVPTQYAPYNIGEKFLRYPLTSEDLSQRKNIKEDVSDIFASYRERRNRNLDRIIPVLKRNSQQRLKEDPNFALFTEEVTSRRKGEKVTSGGYGRDDLQMKEAVEIVKDMIVIQHS